MTLEIGDDESRARPHVLREYALIADGERGALVGPRGDLAWMCAPRWDSDAVFSSLLGASGSFSVTPVGRFVWGGFYEPASLIWRSRWTTETGTVECRDALAFPGDPRRAVILRRVIAVRGDAHVQVAVAPAAGLRPAPDAPYPARRSRMVGGSQRRPAGTAERNRHRTAPARRQPPRHGDRHDRHRRGRPPRPRPGTGRPRARARPPRPRAWPGRRPSRPGATPCPACSGHSRRATPGTPTRCCAG